MTSVTPEDTDWAAPTATTPLDATVALPGSKSLTARALVLAALADSPTVLTGVLRSRDTDLMRTALEILGARFEETASQPNGAASLRVTPLPPAGAAPAPEAMIDCGLAGTVMRFVPPLVALGNRPVLLDGDSGARLRPLSPVLDALTALGAGVEYLGEPGFLPVRLTPAPARPDDAAPSQPGASGGPRRIAVDASGSSQFLSALLLSGCLVPGGLAVTPTGHVPSLPHVAMTVASLRERGIAVDEPDPTAPKGERTWTVHPGRPHGGAVVIEPDLSNAGPFLAAALVVGGEVRVPDWPRTTTQAGDAWRTLLPRLGGQVREIHEIDEPDGSLTLAARGDGHLSGIQADLSEVGELVPTVAALAALASTQGHASRLTGIAHLRGHETNRLAAIVAEVGRLGGTARETADGIEIDALPAGTSLRPARLRGYADHRMATFAALIGLGVPGVTLDDVACTSKTLPDFPALWSAMLTPSSPRSVDPDAEIGRSSRRDRSIGSTGSIGSDDERSAR